jgi:hypothetical protein
VAVYAGRREPILLVVLALDGLFTVVVSGWMIWQVASKRFPVVFLAVAPMLVFSFLSAAWILLRSNYEIAGTDLLVRQGPTRRAFPIATISGAVPVMAGPLAGRVQLSFAPGNKPPTLLIHPQDGQALLQGLAAADSGLAFDGERLTRS